MLGHKLSLSKLKTEIISSIFPNHRGMKPEIDYKNKTRENKDMETKEHVTKQPGGQ